MSLSSLMNLGTRAMFASQAQIQTTGHNIANASVEGYSRQEVSLTTAQGMYTGAGYYGRGVDVQTVERSVNEYLTNEASLARSASSSDETRLSLLQRMEKSFGTGEAGIGYVANQFLQGFSDVAAKPDDLSARQVVLSRAGDLASLFRSTADQLTDLQAATKEDVQNTVKSVNELATKIASVNAQLAGYQGASHTPNDLLDKRDALISELSQHVEVTRVEQDDGSMNLFIGGSQSLVLGANAYQLEALDDPTDTSKVRVAINVDGSQRELGADNLGGGALHGLISFQDDDLNAALSQLNKLAQGLADAVNERQSFGLDLQGQAGQPLFSTTAGMAAQSIKLSGIGAKDLAAANPVVASAGATAAARTALPGEIATSNTGTASISSVVVNAAPNADPTYASALTLVFTDDAGSYKLVSNDDLGGAPVQTGTWSAGQSIDYNGYQLQLSGVPKAKDSFTVEKTTTPAASNGNALAFVSLTTATIIDGATFTNAFASTIADVGVRVQSAERASDVSATIADQAAQNLSSETGVNLDEEAARLLQYQQSYQAAAKVLQVAQKVFDTVLGLGG